MHSISGVYQLTGSIDKGIVSNGDLRLVKIQANVMSGGSCHLVVALIIVPTHRIDPDIPSSLESSRQFFELPQSLAWDILKMPYAWY